MTKVNELKLGDMAQELLALLPEWVKQRPSSYTENLIETESFDIVKRKIYAKFDLLASVAPADFKALLSAEDLMSYRTEEQIRNNIDNVGYYTKKFFNEYLNGNQERKNNFLNNCTGDELSVYVQRSLWCWSEEYPDKRKDHDAFFSEFKRSISELCDLIAQHKSLATKDADILRVLIIERLIKLYSYLSPFNQVKINLAIKTRERQYCANKIADIVKSINDVNTPCEYGHSLLSSILALSDRANQHPKLVKDLACYLVERGVKITNNSSIYESLDIPIYENLFGDDNETQAFLLFALNKNPDTPKKVINEALSKAIQAGNKGAISGLFDFLLPDETWAADKLQFIKLLFETQSRVQRETVLGVLHYFSLNNMSVSDMLAYVDDKYGTTTQDTVIRNLFGIRNNYPEDIKMYLKYEECEGKNVFYYFAQHPEKFAGQDISFYKNNATNKMIIKSNPELCPLTLAINTQNVPFLIFVLEIIGSKANKKLSAKITDGILKLIDQGVDPKNIVSHLENSEEQYTRPFRWFSFEHKLLHAIKAKSRPTGLFWQSCVAAKDESKTASPVRQGSKLTII